MPRRPDATKTHRLKFPGIRGRDWRTLAFALVLPLVLLVLLSAGLSLRVNNLPIVVQDFSDSPASRAFIDAFRASITIRWCPGGSIGHPSER